MAMQVRFQSKQAREDELTRAKSRTSMMLREDARPIGMTTALRAGGTRNPRTTARALSDTLVTRADGSQYWITRKQPTTRKVTTRKRVYSAPLEPQRHRISAADLRPINVD